MHHEPRNPMCRPLWQYLVSLIVVCGGLSLSGCGSGINPISLAATATASSATGSSSASGAGNSSTSTAAGTPTVTPVAAFKSVTNFGDSITCGYYAMPNDGAGYIYSNEGYASLLDTWLKVPAQNLCRGGDQAADMARLWVYPNTQPKLGAGQLYTAMIGTNDVHFCSNAEGCIANWSESLTASLAWLALPASDKVLAPQMTASGTWQPDLAFSVPGGLIAEGTTQTGASLNFKVRQVVAGRSLYVAYRVFDATVLNGGDATVSVDGVVATTLSATVETGHSLATQNGVTDTVFVAVIPLGAVGEHAVTIATAAPGGNGAGGFFSVLWAGVSTDSYAAVAGAPAVAVGSVPITGQAQLNSWADQYNAVLTQQVAALTADGMNIVIAPTGSALSESDLVDLLHPGNGGHARLAAAFESVLPSAPVAQAIGVGP